MLGRAVRETGGESEAGSESALVVEQRQRPVQFHALTAYVKHLYLFRAHAAQPFGDQTAMTTPGIFFVAQEADPLAGGVVEHFLKRLRPTVEQLREDVGESTELHATAQRLTMLTGVPQGSNVQVFDARCLQVVHELRLAEAEFAAERQVAHVDHSLYSLLLQSRKPLTCGVALVANSA